jgi:Protein of unknown function (DUF2800)
VKHQGRAHAWLSASGSSIWLNCTRSPVLSRDLERRSSKYADEGTTAHELAEHKLRGDTTIAGAYPDDMHGPVAVYVDHVAALRARADLHQVEVRVSLADLWDGAPPAEMFGTADFVAVVHRHLYVVDLKYGAGVPVDVKNNTQLMFYALGTYFALRDRTDVVWITMTIVQPRASHEDGPVRSWTTSVVDLLEWAHETLKPTVDRIVAEQGLVTQEGKWCRWCPAAAARCPEKQRTRADEARALFD